MMGKRDNPKKTPGLPNSDENTLSSNETPGPKSTNPFTHETPGSTGGSGDVNPSEPTVGTEGWGLNSNEADTTGRNQGELGRSNGMARDIHGDQPPKRGRSPEEEIRDTERKTVPVHERTFRCADVGNADCRWETSARTEEELMDSIERHGREAHGIRSFDEKMRRRYQDAIRERRAA